MNVCLVNMYCLVWAVSVRFFYFKNKLRESGKTLVALKWDL